MPARKFEIDEITSRLVEGKAVCPYVATCSFLEGPQKIDRATIRHAVTHCSESFEECPIFIMRQKQRSGSDKRPLGSHGEKVERRRPKGNTRGG